MICLFPVFASETQLLVPFLVASPEAGGVRVGRETARKVKAEGRRQELQGGKEAQPITTRNETTRSEQEG